MPLHTHCSDWLRPCYITLTCLQLPYTIHYCQETLKGNLPGWLIVGYGLPLTHWIIPKSVVVWWWNPKLVRYPQDPFPLPCPVVLGSEKAFSYADYALPAGYRFRYGPAEKKCRLGRTVG